MSASDNAPPGAVTSSTEEGLGYLVARVRSAMGLAVHRRAMPELGLTGKQASTLLLVRSGRCVTAAEIAREYGLDASAVTRLVDRLEHLHLLKRGRSPEDRRIVRLSLTAEGEAAGERVRAIVADVTEQCLIGFSCEEIEFMKALLRRMLANSQSAPPSA